MSHGCPTSCHPSTCPIPLSPPPDGPLDPDSPRGRHVAEALSEVLADVITRLRREGVPIPDLGEEEGSG